MKITEEWFEANEWEVHHYKTYDKQFWYANKMFGKDMVELDNKHRLSIFRDWGGTDVYADVIIDNMDSVEKLQEAFVFLGVTQKSEVSEETNKIKTSKKSQFSILDEACEWLKTHREINYNTNDMFVEDFRKHIINVVMLQLTGLNYE